MGIKFDKIASKLHLKYDGFKFDEMTARVPRIFCLKKLQASMKAIASHYSALIGASLSEPHIDGKYDAAIMYV